MSKKNVALKKLISKPCAIDETKVHPALKSYFGYCFYKSAVRMKALHHSYLEEYGLVSPQFGILTVLDFSGPLSQIAMGNEMGIDKATMVKLIDGLEAKKLVHREADTKDRRVKYVQITKKGEQLLLELSKLCKKVEEEFFAVLSKEEKEVLKELIPKLLK